MTISMDFNLPAALRIRLVMTVGGGLVEGYTDVRGPSDQGTAGLGYSHSQMVGDCKGIPPNQPKKFKFRQIIGKFA